MCYNAQAGGEVAVFFADTSALGLVDLVGRSGAYSLLAMGVTLKDWGHQHWHIFIRTHEPNLNAVTVLISCSSVALLKRASWARVYYKNNKSV